MKKIKKKNGIFFHLSTDFKKKGIITLRPFDRGGTKRPFRGLSPNFLDSDGNQLCTGYFSDFKVFEVTLKQWNVQEFKANMKCFLCTDTGNPSVLDTLFNLTKMKLGHLRKTFS